MCPWTLTSACLLQVYHTLFWPLEWTVACRDNNTCYAKIICNKLDNVRHVVGSGHALILKFRF